ncbi:putative reverse transcriptase domain-containing protein [Tanacetum coccineum]
MTNVNHVGTIWMLLATPSDNASSTVTYTSISSNLDGPSQGIPLMNACKIPEIDPYEEVAQQRHAVPLSPAYPYAADASPSALSQGYIIESDQEEDPKEDSEEDPIDYAADTDDDDEEEEPSDDDQEEEYLAPAIALSAVDLVPSAEETESFETDKIFSLPTPPPSLLTPLSSPLPHILSPPTHQPLALLAPSTSRKANIPEVKLPPRKRLLLTAPTLRFEIRESSNATAARQPRYSVARRVDYGFMDTLDASICATEQRAMTTVESVNLRVNYQASVYRRDSEEFQTCHQDAHDDRAALHDEVDTLRRMFPAKSDEVAKYVGGLPDMIQGNVMFARAKTMQEAIKLANDLMDQKVYTYADRQAENKMKQEDNSRSNQNQQQPFKKQNCGAQGHFKKDCPKLKNRNQRNQARVGNVMARAYAIGVARTNLNANVVTGAFLLNNHYASILFDTGADRSFVSTAFSSLIDIIPITLDYGVDIELADSRIIWVNTLIQGCTLNILNHPFNVDLMPIEMGSFDIIIVMDWLSKYQAVIVCAEKIVHIPFGNEILIAYGDGSSHEHGSRLNIISCTKTHKYLLKGCQVFLAHVTTKKAKDKSEEKRLKDVPIV